MARTEQKNIFWKNSVDTKTRITSRDLSGRRTNALLTADEGHGRVSGSGPTESVYGGIPLCWPTNRFYRTGFVVCVRTHAHARGRTHAHARVRTHAHSAVVEIPTCSRGPVDMSRRGGVVAVLLTAKWYSVCSTRFRGHAGARDIRCSGESRSKLFLIVLPIQKTPRSNWPYMVFRKFGFILMQLRKKSTRKKCLQI